MSWVSSFWQLKYPRKMTDIIPMLNILGVTIHEVDFEQTLTQMQGWIERTQEDRVENCRQICTVNPEFVMEARRNPTFAAVLNRADLRVPDGVGILAAARLLGHPLRERVTGSDGIYRISERAALAGWRIFLLGAAPGVAEQAAAILTQRYPGLTVCGTFSGSPADAEWPDIHARLAAAQPDVLLVAYGHPKQDLWIDKHRHELPSTVSIGVGGAFDFVAGVSVRAPVWMQRLGLEWLHRLIREPWRWRRMATLPLFALLVLRQKLKVENGELRIEK